jgi:RNA ligase partner protein
MKFIEEKIPVEKSIRLEKKPPSSYETPITALFLYEFIEEMRNRVNKGLRIAEKYARRGLAGGKEEEIVKAVREEYRVALREGILDSKEDFDLILLAKELNCYLATSDNGLIKWAHKLGIACLSAPELKELISQAAGIKSQTTDQKPDE